MSNILAIAATTGALRNLLLSQVSQMIDGPFNLAITTNSPDVAGKNLTGLTINIFLYQAVHNAAFGNMDMPRQVRPGESANPALALNLHYLITVYSAGETDANADSHRALAAAMSVLHDHPLLGAQELRDALPDSDIADQVERLRITPLPLSIDEISKLWSAFQAGYRMSVAYEVSVLLIDSRRAVKAALPVLRRGGDDRGAQVGAAAGASLLAVIPPASQSAARLGETLRVAGSGLGRADQVIRLTSLAAGGPAPREMPLPAESSAGTLSLTLPTQASEPDALAQWTPGFYSLSVVTRPAGQPAYASNEIMFALAPQLTVAPNNAAVGDLVTLTCIPRVLPGQRVLILFGDRQLAPATLINPDPGDPAYITTPTTLTFEVPDAPAQVYLVRLRVDGVDSIPVIISGTPPLPQFDPAQQVTL